MRITGYPRSRLLLVLTTWLLAVGVATGVGFGALQMIGNRVTDRATPPLSQQAVTSSAGSAAGSANGRVPDAVPTATSPRAGTTRVDSTTTPSSGSQAHPSDDGRPGARSSSSADDEKSFQIRGGTVIATCTGAQIRLTAAYPRDGYRSDVSSRGPDRVEVEFDDRTSRSHIALHCVSGVPTPVREGGEDSGGGDR